MAPPAEPAVPIPDSVLAMTGVPVSLRSYIEAILDEQRRGMLVAEQEREKAASALRKNLEQQITTGDGHLSETLAAYIDAARRVQATAEQEREKAAQALRTELEREIAEGDRNLRDHVSAQIAAVREALESAEKLELERVNTINRLIEAAVESAERALRVAEQEREKAASSLRSDLVRQNEENARNLREHITIQKEQVADALNTVDRRFKAAEHHTEEQVSHLRRERELITIGQTAAIEKAEAATEKRFESVNEFRAQLADQSGSFLPREVAESQFSELRGQIARLQTRLDRGEGAKSNDIERRTQLQPWTIWLAGAGVTIFVTVIVFVANLLTTA